MKTCFTIESRRNACNTKLFQIKFPVFVLFLLMFCQLQTSNARNFRVEESRLLTDFQASLDSLKKQFGFPGATAAYVLPDGTVGVVATGFADMETGTKMTLQSRMLSASIGKTFVGATAVALAIEGVINLDEPLSYWLDKKQWFKHLPNYSKITIRHLLTHSSGLPDHVYKEEFAKEVTQKWDRNENPFLPEDLVGFILDLPPLFEAGKGWAYSDTGYILIGLVIEEATGKNVFDVITEKFLLPLNLILTTPSNSRFLHNLSAGYMVKDNRFGLPVKTTSTTGEMLWHPGFEWTGGGFISNSKDLALWGWTLYRGKAMQYPYLNELLKAVSVSSETDEILYGAGVAIYRNSPLGNVYGHSGWIPGYCSSLRYYADYGIAIAFQINTDIGIIDAPNQVMHEIEIKLAETVIKNN